MREHLAIVGGGQAAAQAAASARQSGFAGRITIVAEEPSLPYQRPPLSKKFLAGELDRHHLLLKPEEFYRTREIDVLVGVRADSVDLAARSLALANGDRLDFSHLLLATGSEPRPLALPGVELGGIHYLRTQADVDALRPAFRAGQRLLVVGAGYIGLEVAAVAVGLGLSVTVLEAMDRAMARTVCSEVSDFYAERHRQAGVELRFGARLSRFVGDTAVRAAQTEGGRIECDLVLIGTGIRPRTGLAESAGLAIDNGIAVDACGRSSAAQVFAAGDCTSHPHPWVGQRVRLESVQNAIEQGKAAAAAVCGREEPFSAVPWFWSDQYDLKLQIAGLSLGYDATVLRGRPDDGSFAVYYLRDDRVIAVDAINDPRGYMTARKRLVEKPRWSKAAIADLSADLATLAG
jgi:3-phenylpropionate/trans-cinnamate dioxygenase ferredoxin reductase subunit